MTQPAGAVQMGEAGSAMQTELDRDANLAERYMQEADAKALHALYVKRCKQLEQFGGVLSTITELYSEKQPSVEQAQLAHAITAMERVALAAIDLAKSIATKE